jgi:hypothetical protein
MGCCETGAGLVVGLGLRIPNGVALCRRGAGSGGGTSLDQGHLPRIVVVDPGVVDHQDKFS